jgi:putative ABC transport system permease protein
VISQARRSSASAPIEVVGRTLTVISKGQKARLQDRRRDQGPAEELAHEDQRDRQSRRPQLHGQGAAGADLLGLPERLGLCAKLRPGTDQGDRGAAPAWEKRNIPDENSGEAHFNAGDDQDWHLVNFATSTSARRRAAR